MAILRCRGAAARLHQPAMAGEPPRAWTIRPGRCATCARKVGEFDDFDMAPPGSWDAEGDFHCPSFEATEPPLVQGGQGRESIKG